MADAGVGAFSVFFIQCASFLEDQAAMKRTKGGRNAQGLVERMNLPSDNQIRGLLDSSLPKLLRPMDRIIFQRVEQAGRLDQIRSHAQSLLVAIDGTEYFHLKRFSARIAVIENWRMERPITSIGY